MNAHGARTEADEQTRKTAHFASHADDADVSPHLPDPGRPSERKERQGTAQTRCLKLFALKQEVVRQLQPWRHERRPSSS